MYKYKSTPKFGEDEEESIYRESDHIDSQATRVRSEGLRPLSRAWYQSTVLHDVGAPKYGGMEVSQFES